MISAADLERTLLYMRMHDEAAAGLRSEDDPARFYAEQIAGSEGVDALEFVDLRVDVDGQGREVTVSEVHPVPRHRRVQDRQSARARLPLTVQVNRRPNVAVHLAGRSASHRQHGPSSSAGSSRSGGEPPDGESDPEPPGLAPAGAALSPAHTRVEGDSMLPELSSSQSGVGS